MSGKLADSACEPVKLVILVDIDNTLLDNDRIQADFQDYFGQALGGAMRDRYWAIQEELFEQLGYRDYLGAVQRLRVEHPNDIRLLAMGAYLMDYPYAQRLYPGALEVLERLHTWGKPVILSDGDAIFQPRKAERAGLSRAVDGRLLIYIHKEHALPDIERRYPADHYVVVDDKLQILTAVTRAWGERVTTVFPRQGKFARDAAILASNPAPDLAIERIGELLDHDLPAWIENRKSKPSVVEERP
jgi:FMN phosphatase YigB (HAD superfamily)